MINCIKNAIRQWLLLWRGVKPYGWELTLDIHHCDPSVFNRPQLTLFFKTLCEKIGMVRADLYFWDYEDHPELKAKAPPHLNGTSAVQFIQTSNITLHVLDDLRCVYLNVFSCKPFNQAVVKEMCRDWFGDIVSSRFNPRW